MVGGDPGCERIIATAKEEPLQPLTLPIATTDTIPGRTIVRYIGPAFGVIARSVGFAKGFTGLGR